jgi:hypothetical protein
MHCGPLLIRSSLLFALILQQKFIAADLAGVKFQRGTKRWPNALIVFSKTCPNLLRTALKNNLCFLLFKYQYY